MDFPGDLTDREIGDLWREYSRRTGDPAADQVLRLIQKLVRDVAWAIPHSSWKDRENHALRQFGITAEKWAR